MNLPPPPRLDDVFNDTLGERRVAADLEPSVEMLCTHARYLSERQRERLIRVLRVDKVRHVEQPSEYGADFDLADEVNQQILAVRAVRNSVMEHGRIKDGVSSREAKEVISTGGTLLSTLLKFHKEMVNMDRLRHIEATVVELLGEEDESLRDKFLSMLELRLEQEEKK